MSVTAKLDGEGIEVEREISERKALKVLEIIFEDEDRNGNGEGLERHGGAEEEFETLPDSFFSRLTNRQEAYVRILLEAEGWVSNEEVRRRLEEDFGLNSGGPQAIAGIRSGFTRKYGKRFSIDERDWMGDQNQYRLNEQYRSEIEERWT